MIKRTLQLLAALYFMAWAVIPLGGLAASCSQNPNESYWLGENGWFGVLIGMILIEVVSFIINGRPFAMVLASFVTEDL